MAISRSYAYSLRFIEHPISYTVYRATYDNTLAMTGHSSSRKDSAYDHTGKQPVPDPRISEAYGQPLPQPIPGLRTLLAQSAEQYAQSPALICMHQPRDIVSIDFPAKIRLQEDGVSQATYLRWSHGQLQYAAQLLAHGLRQRGVQRGQPIATFLTNGMEWAVALRAAAILRCPFVPLNPRGVTNATEVHHMLKTSGARAIIAGDVSIATKVGQAAADLLESMTVRAVLEKVPANIPESWSNFYEFFSSGEQLDQAHDTPMDSPVDSDDDDVALIVFTSGTTSLPKGGIHTNLSAAAGLLTQDRAIKLTSSSRTCCIMPTHHIGGISIALGFMVVGGSTVFPSAAFDPAAALRA